MPAVYGLRRESGLRASGTLSCPRARGRRGTLSGCQCHGSPGTMKVGCVSTLPSFAAVRPTLNDSLRRGLCNSSKLPSGVQTGLKA